VQVLCCMRRESLAHGHCVSPTRRRCRLLLWRPRRRQCLGWSDPADVRGPFFGAISGQIQTGHGIVVHGLKYGGGASPRTSADCQGDSHEIPKEAPTRCRNPYYLGPSMLP